MSPRLRVLELFCGIGGCAAALGDRAEIVAAIDINQVALAVYANNFAWPAIAGSIESLSTDWYRQRPADLWWLSPPCQPYTVRGRQRDIHDPRAASLLAVVQRLAELRPRYVALENVAGFAGSQAHTRLRETLAAGGYEVRERIVCPTELGVPNRRRRFYLLASRHGFGGPALTADSPPPHLIAPPDGLWRFGIRDILDLDAELHPELWMPAEFAEAYRGAIHIVDPDDPAAETHCFTSAYGESFVRSGSYLATPRGLRRFSPQEILRLLCYPQAFRCEVQGARCEGKVPASSRGRVPDKLSLRKAWQLVGNSLSLAAVRYVLSAVPDLPTDN